ncbi:hypothetical protein V8F06_013825, partial [Rhypophila decipiens]
LFKEARYGRHQWKVPACWFDGYHMKAIFLVSFLFGFISFGRAAILLMYRDTFSISRTTHIAIWIGLVLNFLIYIPSIPIAVYYETPRAGQSWEELIYTVPNLEPILVPYGIATGAAALLMDVYIFILPLPVVLRLNLSRTKKIQALAIFATALLAVVASIIALVYRIALGDNLKNDSTWSTTCLFISMLVENNIVLVVASMPAFASFFRHHIAGSTIYTTLLRVLSVSTGSRSQDFNSATGSGKKHHRYNHLDPRPSDSYILSYGQQKKHQENQTAFPMPVLRPLAIGMSGPGRKMKPHPSEAVNLNSYHELEDDSVYCGTSSRTTTRI